MTNDTIPDDLLISVSDAAALVGVSTRTVQRYMARGLLPAVYVGLCAVRIRAGDLRAIVRPRPAKPRSPMAT